MLFTEYNEAKETQITFDSGKAEGLAEGRAEGIAEATRGYVLNMTSQGMETVQISTCLGIPPSQVESIISQA